MHGQALGLVHTPVRMITPELPIIGYRTRVDLSSLNLRLVCLLDKSKTLEKAITFIISFNEKPVSVSSRADCE